MTTWNFENDKENSFEAIPTGKYNLIVSGAEMKQTKNGDDRLSVTFSVSDGEFRGRKIFEGYQMSGNEKAVQIGRGQIKALLKAANKSFNIKGPEDLLNIEITAQVKLKNDPAYGDRNSVASFKPKEASEPSDGVPF